MENTKLFYDIDIRYLEKLDDKRKLRELVNIVGIMTERLDHALSNISEDNLCEKLRNAVIPLLEEEGENEISSESSD